MAFQARGLLILIVIEFIRAEVDFDQIIQNLAVVQQPTKYEYLFISVDTREHRPIAEVGIVKLKFAPDIFGDVVDPSIGNKAYVIRSYSLLELHH